MERPNKHMSVRNLLSAFSISSFVCLLNTSSHVCFFSVSDPERGEEEGKKIVIERKEFHSSYYQELANSKAIRYNYIQFTLKN